MAEADPKTSQVRPATGPLRTIQLVRERSVEALLGRSGLNHPALAAEIRRRFGSTDVNAGALVREPVIEGAAPFEVDGRTFADCAGTLLHTDVIRAISSEAAGDYRFPPEAQPYRHQIEAWQHLTSPEPRSVLVSSGTGSGKTECFLMPLLHDLATEAQQSGRLSGIRALALYPLNALIASQEERLRAWTAPFRGKVRFGLYNGLTPERLRQQDKPGPEQVADRETLRKDPPPILVTNVTMLEYMLVRRIDRPLVENSRGKLRWIILDEAHSYVGSSAAEIALLLRRVLLTFGVKAEDVRFVATSATIGGEGVDVTDELRRFLRDITGVSDKRVHIVLGQREKVLLPAPAASSELTAADLFNRDKVAASPAVQRFIQETEQKAISLERAASLLAPVKQPLEAVIEAIAQNRDKQRGPLLPLRIHGFLRAVPGMWSCINPECEGKPDGWPYGAISPERIDTCPCCRAPVFEILTCNECGEPYLDCEERDGKLQARFTPPVLDEFAELREQELTNESEGEGFSEEDTSLYETERHAIAVRPLPDCRNAHVEPLTGTRHDAATDTTRPYPIHTPDGCGSCGASVSAKKTTILRPFRFGAPYLIGNAAPVMLEGVEPRKLDKPGAYRPPAEGRQLLSFTDSRQGSARFAANLQTTSERMFVRGYIYHAVQGSIAAGGEDDPNIAAMRNEIEMLESSLVHIGKEAPPALKDLLDNKKASLAEKLKPRLGGIPWPELRTALARQPEVKHWMMKVWGPREDRYRKDPHAFAEFLLLREFDRRPRRGNTLETMGLARLRFDAVDNAKNLPDLLRARGKTIADWQGLLYSILDMTVRGRSAIRAEWTDLHWLRTHNPLSVLLPPGVASQARRELTWPYVENLKGLPSNLVLILEKALQLDRHDAADRHAMNEVLEAAWWELRPLFTSPQHPDYALDFSKARIAPVTDAWLCPVTGRVLPATALGLTQYGHREHLRPANEAPNPLQFPRLPHTFPQGEQVNEVRKWLTTDPHIQSLRSVGIWGNLHDRIATLSPYTRAAEHSAQQPASRLRRFEEEFKQGEINILNCSTTMEMGVDIGSVSAVMMTNVPPSLANYRQRVGRAGRRRQGFASSLTYTRDTPLDRETFRDPVGYLSRQTRAPQVRLDSRRIVQRHVNALLLARWFASAGGEAMNVRAGEFFGCPDQAGAPRPETVPAQACAAWITAPSTQQDLKIEVARLVAGTVLEGDQTLFREAAEDLSLAESALVAEWESLQTQIASVAKDEGRASLEYQLKRLTRENLLKELVVRGFLPGHGLPTAVVSFVHEAKRSEEEARDDNNQRDEANQRRRSYPSRTLDIAIRDYAPGSEVVIDGLVYRSAGVTLNWQRPVDDEQAREIQSMRVFWSCPSCGAADCTPVAPDHCPSCREELPMEAQRRFLEPGGFVVDMHEKPHADTDSVTYIASEAEQIVARNAAWQPLVAPALGRMRASADGLVFYSSRGPNHRGYHVCLECGRAEPVTELKNGQRPLHDHKPLRGSRRNADGLCPGNDKSFKITAPIALGYPATTDVAELQPVGLEESGAAWAAAAALREALARRIGVEINEIGISVRPARTTLGQRTHSLYLYDRATGGAGFAPQAVHLFEDLLADATKILDCTEPGCTRGCSACVLTADIFQHQETVDRQAALTWAQSTLAALGNVPEADRAAADARYCASLADALVQAAEGQARTITVWAGPETDVIRIADGLFAFAARQIVARGTKLRLVIEPGWLDSLDPAARLALRDAAKLIGLELRIGVAGNHANGARTLAYADGLQPFGWVSRDPAATNVGDGWGRGAVRISMPAPSLMSTVELDSLLPSSGTQYLELTTEFDGNLSDFGRRFAELVVPRIRAAGGNGKLVSISYNDRYLHAPLPVRLLAEAVNALRNALGCDGSPRIAVITDPLRPDERQPFAPEHNWQHPDDRNEVLIGLLERFGFDAELLDHGAVHGRYLKLQFSEGKEVRVILDQGFGAWRVPKFARFDFGTTATNQLTKLTQFNAILTARGPGYIVITP